MRQHDGARGRLLDTKDYNDKEPSVISRFHWPSFSEAQWWSGAVERRILQTNSAVKCRATASWNYWNKHHTEHTVFNGKIIWDYKLNVGYDTFLPYSPERASRALADRCIGLRQMQKGLVRALC